MAARHERRFAPEVSDDAVRARTGRGFDEWFKLIDEAGGAELGHKGIVELLARNGEVEPWWQQTITVSYERAVGLRERYQRPDGFQISRTRTLDTPLLRVWAAWVDPELRERWLPGETLTIRKATPSRSLRITWSDGSYLDVEFNVKPPDRCQLVVQHRKLPDADAAARAKAFWGERLDGLQELLAAGERE